MTQNIFPRSIEKNSTVMKLWCCCYASWPYAVDGKFGVTIQWRRKNRSIRIL